MEKKQSKSTEQIIRHQIKDDLKIKSKMVVNIKNKKTNSFKSSLEKIFRIKSKSEKSIKYDDLKTGIIPQTIYLTPQQTKSISREIENIQKHIPTSNQTTTHFCSEYPYHQNSTFFVAGNIKPESVAFPHSNTFYPSAKNNLELSNNVSISKASVPHSKSMPSNLSKSQQNINHEVLNSNHPAKRTVRRKGIFNCSLFRRRSSSHSKSAEKVTDVKPKKSQSRDQSKSDNRSEKQCPSTLSDRCLTLPNLKSSEMDLIQDSNSQQLFSLDLIKDYLNRSNSSLQLTVQTNSVDTRSINLPQPLHSAANSSPQKMLTRKSDRKRIKRSNTGASESLITDNHNLLNTFYSQQSASNEMFHSRCSQTISPIADDRSILDRTTYKISTITIAANESHKPPLEKQISAPVYYQSAQSFHRHLSPLPTDSAFDFWTRPYQEKLKASRRRLLDDKVGSKEALLRSLSPHNIKLNNGSALYDNPYQLHIIPEPMTVSSIEPKSTDLFSKDQSLSHSKSFYNSVQYRAAKPVETVLPDYQQHRSSSPVIENCLLKSPLSSARRPETLHQTGGYGDLISNEVCQIKTDKSTLTAVAIMKSEKERNQTTSDKILPLRRNHFEGSLPEFKDTKSINSSTELVLTRTPTPPHSFAESPVSSIYPVPNEFISDMTKSRSHPNRLCGNTNLLYASDNSDDDTDNCIHTCIDTVPPIPPPRTDSVIRSLQVHEETEIDKSELEYDISDEFPPVFSGANIERCDIEQYHKWLEKLPYKIDEFPNLIHTENVHPNTVSNDVLLLKELKQPRKTVKSWNTSGHFKPQENPSFSPNDYSNFDSSSLKRSHSYDQCLNNSNLGSIEQIPTTSDQSSPIPTIDCTLLKQYSHLYSLKPSPSQTKVLNEISRCSIIKSTRSKSIDLRQFVENCTSSTVSLSEKYLDNTQNRKSVPNSRFNFVSDTNDVSGNGKLDSVESEFKVYPML